MYYYSYRIVVVGVVVKQYDRHRWSLLSQLLSLLYNFHSNNYLLFVAYGYIAAVWSTFCLLKFEYYNRHMTHLSILIYKQTLNDQHIRECRGGRSRINIQLLHTYIIPQLLINNDVFVFVCLLFYCLLKVFFSFVYFSDEFDWLNVAHVSYAQRAHIYVN